MREKLISEELRAEFGDEPFTSAQLYQFYLDKEPSLKENTFRWRVYHLKKQNVIFSIKRGLYVLEGKRDFSPIISKNARWIYKRTREQFPYCKISIWETSWLTKYMVHQPLTNNIIVEVDKDAVASVFAFLQDAKKNVFINPNKHEIETYIMTGQSAIIVKNLVVEAPVEHKENMDIPRIEKIMVDLFAENDLLVMYQGNELRNIYESFFDVYNINQSTLNRYASKRNVKEQIVKFIIEETDIRRENLYI